MGALGAAAGAPERFYGPHSSTCLRACGAPLGRLNGGMDARLARLLSADLSAAGFTDDRIRALAGPAAVDAAGRADGAPLRRALRRVGEDAAAVLGRLFVLGDAVAAASLRPVLSHVGIEGAAALGVLRIDGDAVEPLVAIRPHAFGIGAEGWIASDLDELAGVSPLPADHVLGIGGAGRTLVALLPPAGTGRALDLGCGCGVVALHLRRRGYEVVATDVSERALWFTRLNTALNGMDGVEVRRGSLFEPVAGERFALIASNPPFVITPRRAGVPLYEYRDGGAAGDALMAEVVAGAGSHLSEGGQARLLGNWERRGGRDGLDRLRSWAQGVGVWAIEREWLDPVRYAELWVRDGGQRPGSAEHDMLVEAWLDDFAERGVAGVGLGWVVLARDLPISRMESVSTPIDHAHVGAHIAEALDAAARLTALDDTVLTASILRVAGDVTEARHHMPGSESPSVIELHQGGALGRTVDADPALVALVGASDGDLTVGALIAAIAELLEVEPDALRDDLLPRVRELIFTGFLAFD